MNHDPALFPALPSKAEVEGGLVLAPRFGPDGTVTCVTVDAEDGRVLMLAHMNAESLARTIRTGEGWYWSRTRGELWHKGATSGNVQKVVELLVDCDQDALVLRVRVEGHGASCHTGHVSCFYRTVALGQDATQGPVVLTMTAEQPRFDPADVYDRS